MADIVQSIKNRNAAIKEVAGWTDNTPPTPVPRPVPDFTDESPASQALNNAQKAINKTIKKYGY